MDTAALAQVLATGSFAGSPASSQDVSGLASTLQATDVFDTPPLGCDPDAIKLFVGALGLCCAVLCCDVLCCAVLACLATCCSCRPLTCSTLPS
jgi:hypothetical protein